MAHTIEVGGDRPTAVEGTHAAATSATGTPAPGFAELSDDALGGRICELAGRIAEATCRWLEMIAEFDRRHGWSGAGIKSCAHWLALHCSVAPSTAREHLRVARALGTLPKVSASFRRGELSYSKVRSLTRVSDRIAEDTLLNLATAATASQLERTVRGFRKGEGDRLAQLQRRSLRWRTEEDGTVVLTAELPSEEGALLIAALEAATQQLQRTAVASPAAPSTAGAPPAVASSCGAAADHAPEDAGTSAPAPGSPVADRAHAPGHLRPLTDGARHRRGDLVPQAPDRFRPVPLPAADALLHVAEQFLAATPTDRSGADSTMVVVHVDAATLAGKQADAAHSRSPLGVPVEAAATGTLPTSGLCQITGVGGISIGAAQQLSCDATVVGVIRDGRGAVLAHGRKRRLISPAQRRALAIRDGCCQYPGCDRTRRLQAHHVVPWIAGGTTDLDNLVLLCGYHHAAVHEGLARIQPAAGEPSGQTCATVSDGHGSVRDGSARDGSVRDGAAADGSARARSTRWRFQLRRKGSWLDPLKEPAPRTQDEGMRLWSQLRAAGMDDPAAQPIRPGWAGEDFDLDHIVWLLFQYPREPAPPPGGGTHSSAPAEAHHDAA